MAMQFIKPSFDWEAKDWLSELEHFKQECSVLFQGPLSEMKDASKSRPHHKLDRKTVYYDTSL